MTRRSPKGAGPTCASAPTSRAKATQVYFWSNVLRPECDGIIVRFQPVRRFTSSYGSCLRVLASFQ